MFIDNTFIHLFLFQGLIGLGLFLAIYWAIWKRLLRRIDASPEPFAIGVTCSFSGFLAAGVLNILNGQWWGIMIALTLMALSDPWRWEAACAA